MIRKYLQKKPLCPIQIYPSLLDLAHMYIDEGQQHISRISNHQSPDEMAYLLFHHVVV